MKNTLALLLSVTLLACGNPVEEVVDRQPKAIVYGLITDQKGSPVADAIVTVRTFAPREFTNPETCNDSGAGLAKAVTTTSQGYYRRMLIGGALMSYVCVVLEVAPPAGSSLARKTGSVTAVKLEYGSVVDSTRLDIMLEPGN